MNDLTEYIGVIGGAFYLLAFTEAALGRWNGKSFWYEANNLLGSIFLGYYAVKKETYVNIALNLVWGVVALYAIRHMIHRHKARKTSRRKTKKRSVR